MKKDLMFLVVAGSWVLWANTANAEITMKITGCFPVEEARYDSDWWVETWTGPEDDIYDISEDGTFTTDVPEGTKLLASIKKDPLEIPIDPEGVAYFRTDWTPAKDGGELIACTGMPGGIEELKNEYLRRQSELAN